MLRVVQYVNYFFPSIGGTQFATYFLARALKDLGVDVKIVAMNLNPVVSQGKNGFYSAGLPRFEIIDGLPVHRFPVVFVGETSRSKRRYKIMVSPGAIRMILSDNPDIVHFQGTSEILQTLVTSYFSVLSRSKTVLTVHGIHEQADLFKNQVFARNMNELLLKSALNRVSHVVALSRLDLAVTSRLGVRSEKVSVIPNGVSIERFQAPMQDESSSDQGIDVSEPYVLCVTRIRENKGIEFLIEAAAKVISRRQDTRFIVVGNCPETYSIKLRSLVQKAKIASNFLFMGHLPESTLLKLYRHASIFVLPSLSETLPLVLLEAMAARLPIVASEVGGIPELISPSEGILTRPGNVTELSSSLLLLLDNESLRRRLSQNAGKKAEDYSWDRIAKKTLSLYEKLVA